LRGFNKSRLRAHRNYRGVIRCSTHVEMTLAYRGRAVYTDAELYDPADAAGRVGTPKPELPSGPTLFDGIAARALMMDRCAARVAPARRRPPAILMRRNDADTITRAEFRRCRKRVTAESPRGDLSNAKADRSMRIALSRRIAVYLSAPSRLLRWIRTMLRSTTRFTSDKISRERPMKKS